MQSGIITEENLDSVLREISQRRRSGALEITHSDSKIKIFFHIGRIVDVAIPGKNPIEEVLPKLVRAKYLTESLALECRLEGSTDTLDALFNRLKEEGLEKGTFIGAVRHITLDYLYSLNLQGGGYYQFQGTVSEHRGELAPSISVGQLLLDLVALRAETPRFNEVFPAGDVVALSGEAGSELLSDDELMLVHSLQNGPVTVHELQGLTLLSVYSFQEAMFALYERGYLIQAPEPDDDEPLTDDLFSALGSLPKVESIQDPMVDRGISSSEASISTETSNTGVIVNLVQLASSSSLSLTQSQALVNVLSMLFVALALILPLFAWQHVLESFSL